MTTSESIEPLGHVRTKIVATLGPKSREPATLRALIEAGVDLFRMNFSHGTHEQHSIDLAAVRAVAEELQRPIGVLQDLGGPKIRLGPIPGDQVECNLGERFQLVPERTSDDPRELTCTYRDLAGDLGVGDPVLFADGAVAMRVTSRDGNAADLEVTLAGTLRSRQGLNLPGAALSVEALTEKDLADLEWTARNPVEYIGLSFVRRAADVERLRSELAARRIRSRIVAKIEKPQAVDDLEAIIGVSDAVMVARGDLGVEMDVARVPAVQKQIIASCRRARVPVITATQMLSSMEHSNRPTRAEATDVFNAVLDGTDAVMLSGETAVGDYPVDAVAVMSRIAAEAERLLQTTDGEAPPSTRPGWITPVTEGIVDAASRLCRRLDAALLVVATHSGRTALAASKHRNMTPTLALSDDPEIARQMNLYWGVTPVHAPNIADGASALEAALAWARPRGMVRTGGHVVLVRGTIPGNPVHNALFVQIVD